MGGTAPYCPFCHKLCASSGVKDHVFAKHPDQYKLWVNHGMLPYWQYDDKGNLKDLDLHFLPGSKLRRTKGDHEPKP